MDSRKIAIEAHKARELLQLAADELDDEERMIVADTETDLTAAIQSVLDAINATNDMIAGISERKKEMDARKKRLEARVEKYRTAICQVIDDLGIKFYELPEARLTATWSQPSVVITDQTAIPRQYLFTPPPVPIKTEIGKILKAGGNIPGAELSNARRTLTIRKS